MFDQLTKEYIERVLKLGFEEDEILKVINKLIEQKRKKNGLS